MAPVPAALRSIMSGFVGLLWAAVGRVLDERGLEPLAQSCFRRAIEVAPAANTSRTRLGRLLVSQGRYAEALPIMEQATIMRPRDAAAWNMLGVARRENDDMPGARAAFEHALSIEPEFALAQNNYGNWLLAEGRAAEGLDWFNRALRQVPDLHEALNNRIVALLDLGRSDEAEAAAHEALERYPDSAALHLNLGNSYLQLGKGYRAAQSYKKAVMLQPGFQEAHFNLSLLGLSDGLGEATAFLKKQIERKGRSVDLLTRLGVACIASFSLDEAEILFREIITVNPRFASAYVGLGNVLSMKGEAREALACYREAVELNGDHRSHSNLLFELNYLPEYSPDSIFEQHIEWARRHEQPLLAQRKAHGTAADRERKIRIGYVSADFHHHPVGYLINGVIPQHDRERFEIHCYSHDSRTDSITDALRQSADFWHDTMGLSDGQLADKVFDDGIDILVDLSGHTAKHRLPAFARKPAPVQVSWIGYFHSTGMETIDYFISDPYTSPPDSGQQFSEVLVHLPNTRFCYEPPDYVPEVVEPPCIAKGFVTFGCFNKLAKISDEVVATWAQVLNRVPDARLRLKSAGLNVDTVCAATFERFARHGIDRSRLELRPPSSHAQMFSEYGDIDIALDPFPFAGGMTSFEALLMGVPVVTLAGRTVVSRQTASMLANLGLVELIHETPDSYIEGAVALARSPERLAALRARLRPLLQQSPLCDMRRFTKDLEHLYQRMWQARCNNTRLPSALLQPTA